MKETVLIVEDELIVATLVDNMDKFKDWDNPLYSNIESLKKLEGAIEVHSLAAALER